MTPMGEEVRAALGSGPDAARRTRQRARFVAEARGQKARWFRELAIGGLAAALGSVAVFAVWQQRAPAGLEAPVRQGDAFVFNEASRVELQPGAQARVETATGHEAVVVLERGELNVSITSGLKNRWRFRAGENEVIVRGTKFSMLWSPSSQALDVQVSEGKVEVHTADGQLRFVTAGHRLSYAHAPTAPPDLPGRGGASSGEPRSPADLPGRGGASSGEPRSPAGLPGRGGASSGELRSPAEHAEADVVHVDEEPQVVEQPHDEAPGKRPTSKTVALAIKPVEAPAPSQPQPELRALVPEWKRQAEAGRYAKAVALVEEQGVGPALLGVGSDDLLLFADAARLARRADLGRAALQTLRERHAGTAGAAEAAFRLGRLEFDAQHFAEAGTWFDTYAKEAPQGHFLAEALGRRLDAWHRANDARAAQAASDYLGREPKGAYAALARQVLEGR